MSPKSKRHQASQPKADRDALIRHHLEEASTHLAAVKELLPGDSDYGNGARKHLTRAGQSLQLIYRRHGGIPH